VKCCSRQFDLGAGPWSDTEAHTSPPDIHPQKNLCRMISAGVCFKPVQAKSSRRMGFSIFTVGVTREDLTRDCLRDLRLWPGCETVDRIGILAGQDGKFTAHVIEYGDAKKQLTDRALRCVQREKARRFHLKEE
jgi:hypothetical protein